MGPAQLKHPCMMRYLKNICGIGRCNTGCCNSSKKIPKTPKEEHITLSHYLLHTCTWSQGKIRSPATAVHTIRSKFLAASCRQRMMKWSVRPCMFICALRLHFSLPRPFQLWVLYQDRPFLFWCTLHGTNNLLRIPNTCPPARTQHICTLLNVRI